MTKTTLEGSTGAAGGPNTPGSPIQANQRAKLFRKRGGTRDQHLAQMQNALKDFGGKITDLPVLSKQHENVGVTYERFTQDLIDYITINWQRGEDLRDLIEYLDDDYNNAIGNEPQAGEGDEVKFKIEYTRYLDRVDKFTENKKKLFTAIMGQCTPGLITVIKSHSEYGAKVKQRDPKWLLGVLAKLTVGIEEKLNAIKTVHDCVRKVFT